MGLLLPGPGPRGHSCQAPQSKGDLRGGRPGALPAWATAHLQGRDSWHPPQWPTGSYTRLSVTQCHKGQSRGPYPSGSREAGPMAPAPTVRRHSHTNTHPEQGASGQQGQEHKYTSAHSPWLPPPLGNPVPLPTPGRPSPLETQHLPLPGAWVLGSPSRGQNLWTPEIE